MRSTFPFPSFCTYTLYLMWTSMYWQCTVDYILFIAQVSQFIELSIQGEIYAKLVGPRRQTSNANQTQPSVDRQIDRQIDIQIDRQIDGQIDNALFKADPRSHRMDQPGSAEKYMFYIYLILFLMVPYQSSQTLILSQYVTAP